MGFLKMNLRKKIIPVLLILLALVSFLQWSPFYIPEVKAQGTITYNRTYNYITISGFTESSPCTFTDLYLADTNGQSVILNTLVLTENWVIPPDYQIQPADSKAVQLIIVVSGVRVSNCYIEIEGADWLENYQFETIYFSSGSGTYYSVYLYRWVDTFYIYVPSGSTLTITIYQERWGVVWMFDNYSKQYRIDAKIQQNTYFADSDVQITVGNAFTGTIQPWFTCGPNSYTTFGILIDSITKRTKSGVQFLLDDPYNYSGTILFTEVACPVGALRFYGCSFILSGLETVAFRGMNVIAYETTVSKGTIWQDAEGSYLDAYKLILEEPPSNAMKFPNGVLEDIYIHSAKGYVFWYSGAYVGNVTYAKVRNSTGAYTFRMEGISKDHYFINPDIDQWTFHWIGINYDKKLYRQYTFDLTITYPNGTVFEGADVTITYEGQGGGTAYSGTTDGNGQIPTQTLTYGFYKATGGGTIYDYNPYNLIITATNYQVYTKKFILANKTNWEIALTTLVKNNPVARFNNTITTVKTNQTVTFDGSMSYDPDGGNITNYSWDFGDGNVTSGNYPIITHKWATNGNYTLNLTVTDDESATNSFSWIINVLDYLPPIASFSFQPSGPRINQEVAFNASSSSDTDGYIISYEWFFGDNTKGTGIAINHTYTTAGLYNVTLKVTDSQNLTDTFSAFITVTANLPPKARFVFSPSNPQPSQTITFDASSSQDEDGTIISYFWKFGDGTNSTGITTTHKYNAEGKFSVLLNVTDNDNATNTFTQTITVSIPPIPTPSPEYHPVSVVKKTFDLTILVKDQYRYPIENVLVQIFLDQKLILEGKTDEFGAFIAKRQTATKTYLIQVVYNEQKQEQSVLLDQDKTISFEYSLISFDMFFRMIERNWLLMALLFVIALSMAISWKKTGASILLISATLTIFISDYKMLPFQFKLFFLVVVVGMWSLIFKFFSKR